jgi:anti-sigma regulatory factor (Ser/Thr protein kinase)
MGENATWSHEICLPCAPRSPARARAFVCEHLVEHRLLYLVDTIRLVVSELATNAMAHALTPFTVTLSQQEQTVTLAVRDESTVIPTPATPHIMDTSGRGLTIVDILSTDCGCRVDDEGAKTMWSSFAMRQPQPA